MPGCPVHTQSPGSGRFGGGLRPHGVSPGARLALVEFTRLAHESCGTPGIALPAAVALVACGRRPLPTNGPRGTRKVYGVLGGGRGESRDIPKKFSVGNRLLITGSEIAISIVILIVLILINYQTNLTHPQEMVLPGKLPLPLVP